MKGSFNPQRSCNPQVENHCTSITYVGIPWFAMVIAVIALSLLPRRAQTLDMLALSLTALVGGSTLGVPGALQKPQQNIPIWGTEAAPDPLPQQPNPSLCASLGLLVAAPWRSLCEGAANWPLGALCLKSDHVG